MTNTPIPPTATSTATSVPPTATSTATSVPPTATSTATPVPPTATNTPIPPTATPAADVIFADGFDGGSLAAWSGTGGTASRLSVTAGAAQSGGYGLQAAITSGSAGYVVDNSPNNETSYHARFYLNPHGATINSTAQDILVGLNAANQMVFRVQLRRSGSNYQIRSVITRSGGSTNTSWYTISNAYHAIEISWQTASSASFSLYIDGALKQTAAKLNTSAYTIKSVRLGPSGGLSGSPGSEYFDNFRSTRSSYIGP
ncbi:MAG: hypothetical protein R2911_00910 [Caldilineaceae bacterium]